MSLRTIYERFLASPNPLSLSEDVTLQYITTLTTFKQQGPVIKHLENQYKNVVKKESEKIISIVEGPSSIAIVAETTLEFVSSGGAYLPGLDTFILDRKATLPITHFVHFDRQDKISNIRLSWDQGDLLKQVEVIGSRARAWPVYDGREQIKMITASATSMQTATESSSSASATALSPRGRTASRSASPSKKFVRDPHASLDLTNQPQDQRTSQPNPVAPRDSIRPAEREMSDLFAAGHEDYEIGPTGSPRKISKQDVIAPKGAGHKKFQPSKVFEEEELKVVPERHIYKTNPARYNHFDIGDAYENDTFQDYGPGGKRAEDMPIRPKGGNIANKNKAQWGFDADPTPERPASKGRDVNRQTQDSLEQELDTHHHGHGARGRKDQVSQINMTQDSPIHRPAAPPKPRKDQASQFDIIDQPSPGPRRIIARTAAAQKLYHDPVFGNEEEDRPLAPISNNTARKDPVTTKPGRRDVQSHWDF